MKAIVIYGSKRNGSTSKAAIEHLLRGAKEAGYDNIVEYDINKIDLKGCRNCGACKNSDGFCVINDDLKEYFEELTTADALIISSPNYMSNVIGPIITFMNRHYCLRDAERNLKLKNKVKLISVYSQGAPAEMPAYEANYDWLTNCFVGMGMENAGKIVMRGAMPEEGSEIFTTAYELGKNL